MKNGRSNCTDFSWMTTFLPFGLVCTITITTLLVNFGMSCSPSLWLLSSPRQQVHRKCASQAPRNVVHYFERIQNPTMWKTLLLKSSKRKQVAWLQCYHRSYPTSSGIGKCHRLQQHELLAVCCRRGRETNHLRRTDLRRSFKIKKTCEKKALATRQVFPRKRSTMPTLFTPFATFVCGSRVAVHMDGRFIRKPCL